MSYTPHPLGSSREALATKDGRKRRHPSRLAEFFIGFHRPPSGMTSSGWAKELAALKQELFKMHRVVRSIEEAQRRVAGPARLSI